MICTNVTPVPAPDLYLEIIAIVLEMAASLVLYMCTDETTREREGFTDPELGRSLC